MVTRTAANAPPSIFAERVLGNCVETNHNEIVICQILCISTLSLLALFHAPAEKRGISREQAETLVSGLKFQQDEITCTKGGNLMCWMDFDF
jgi:hypothetical protein